MEEKEVYLYFHINPVKNQVFYVGIGINDRAYHKKRSKLWYNTVNKYNYVVDIVEKGLSWEEACERERFYIKKIGRKDLGLGPLVNHTDGGDGVLGYKHKDISKQNISKKLIGIKRDNFKTWKTKKETNKGISKGKPWTEARRLAEIKRKQNKI